MFLDQSCAFFKVTMFHPDVIFYIPNPPRCYLSSIQKKYVHDYSWHSVFASENELIHSFN